MRLPPERPTGPATSPTRVPGGVPGRAAAALTDEPAGFAAAAAALRAFRPRPALVLSEVPPPRRLAPWALAWSAELVDPARDEELASGRFVVLHDPAGQPGWGGPTRVVAYVRALVEQDMAADPLLPQAGWSWLVEALAGRAAAHDELGGTVTRTTSAAFGALPAADPGDDSGPGGAAEVGEVQIRASWTPVPGAPDAGLVAHLAAYCDLLYAVAGLPPDGVTALPTRPRTGA